MSPLQLPEPSVGGPPPTPQPAAPAKAGKTGKVLAGTHAAVTAALLAVVGTQTVNKPAPTTASASAVAAYEAQLVQLWAQEDATDKAASLKQMIFLLARAERETLEQDDLLPLYRSFRQEEKTLGLVHKLPKLRMAIRTEWGKQVPEVAPAVLTEPLRQKLVSFFKETIGILEKLK